MKKEIKCKDEMLKLWNEKFHKLNEEKESIRIMNRELQKNIDELKNQCNDYQTVINYNQEQIKLLKEKNNKGIGKFSSKKVSFNLPVKENEEKKNINKNENNENNEKEDENNDLGYKGNEINLNELIFDESESADHELVDKKSQLKLAFTRVKNIRRFTRLKSLNYNNKKIILAENNNRKAKQKKTII